MKLITFERRLNGIAKNSNAYEFAKKLLTNGGRVYTCHTSGSGKYTGNIDRTKETIDALGHLNLKENIDFVVGNDSPRGGKTGNFVELTSYGNRKKSTNGKGYGIYRLQYLREKQGN